jgi:hypothetical protein
MQVSEEKGTCYWLWGVGVGCSIQPGGDKKFFTHSLLNR